jgi:hypothetical protein
MAKLQKTKLNFENKLLELQNSARQFDTPVFPETFQQFAVSFGSKLKKADRQPELQAAIIRKVVHRIEICPNGFDIHFHVGQEHYRRELDKPADGMGVARSYAKSKNPIFLKDNGSKSLKNGDRGRTRTSDPQFRKLVLYPAELHGLYSIFQSRQLTTGVARLRLWVSGFVR